MIEKFKNIKKSTTNFIKIGLLATALTYFPGQKENPSIDQKLNQWTPDLKEYVHSALDNAGENKGELEEALNITQAPQAFEMIAFAVQASELQFYYELSGTSYHDSFEKISHNKILSSKYILTNHKLKIDANRKFSWSQDLHNTDTTTWLSSVYLPQTGTGYPFIADSLLKDEFKHLKLPETVFTSKELANKYLKRMPFNWNHQEIETHLETLSNEYLKQDTDEGKHAVLIDAVRVLDHALRNSHPQGKKFRYTLEGAQEVGIAKLVDSGNYRCTISNNALVNVVRAYGIPASLIRLAAHVHTNDNHQFIAIGNFKEAIQALYYVNACNAGDDPAHLGKYTPTGKEFRAIIQMSGQRQFHNPLNLTQKQIDNSPLDANLYYDAHSFGVYQLPGTELITLTFDNLPSDGLWLFGTSNTSDYMPLGKEKHLSITSTIAPLKAESNTASLEGAIKDRRMLGFLYKPTKIVKPNGDYYFNTAFQEPIILGSNLATQVELDLYDTNTQTQQVDITKVYSVTNKKMTSSGINETHAIRGFKGQKGDPWHTIYEKGTQSNKINLPLETVIAGVKTDDQGNVAKEGAFGVSATRSMVVLSEKRLETMFPDALKAYHAEGIQQDFYAVQF